jgi:hypothetical protein
MNDSVAQLRARWTPELTAAAIAFLQGNPSDVDIPTMEHDGATYLDLRGIRIEGTQLDGMLIRNVNLRWSTIRDVGFKGAKLVECNLSQAQFAECYFRRAVFQKCDIVNARFEKSDFSNARLEASRLDFATFKECEITLQSIRFRDDAPPQVLARVCRNLKLNAMQMGHFADAGELTYREKTFERRALYNQAASGKNLAAIGRWFGSATLSLLWGYGEKPGRLAFGSALIIFLFGTLQYWLGAVPGQGWWDHVYFSGITFLTVGYGDLVPLAPLPRLVSVLEGATGIVIIGLLIASATKKIMYR